MNELRIGVESIIHVRHVLQTAKTELHSLWHEIKRSHVEMSTIGNNIELDTICKRNENNSYKMVEATAGWNHS